MELEKIKESDLDGKGVVGQPEVPGLSAEEMQRKIEEIVREIAIPKINEVIEYIAERVAKNEDLEKLLIDSGSVISVFGRAGNVTAKSGDYTAEMVGAAAKKHAAQHFADGNDPITAEKIGAAGEVHAHGSISSDGKIGSAGGMFLVTGTGGKIETKSKGNCGFVLPPEQKAVTGTINAEDNKLYMGDGITNFTFNCDSGKTVNCRGFITFGKRGTVSLNGFAFIDDPDDIKTAADGSRWEFDLSYGCLIIRKRSA